MTRVEQEPINAGLRRVECETWVPPPSAKVATHLPDLLDLIDVGEGVHTHLHLGVVSRVLPIRTEPTPDSWPDGRVAVVVEDAFERRFGWHHRCSRGCAG